MSTSHSNPTTKPNENTSSSNSPVPTSLAMGVRGSGPVNAREAETTQVTTTAGRAGAGAQKENESVDAEDSMATLAESDVATAEQRKSGTQLAPGQKTEDVVFDDYAADLERKKAEQADARERIKQARKDGEDVD